MKRVVITGLGTINPLAVNVTDFWNSIKANKIGFSFIDSFDTERTGVKIAGIVRDFDETEYYDKPGCFDKKESRKMDRFTKFAVAAARESLDDCGSDFKDIDPYRAGVIMGCGIGGIGLTLEQHSKYLEKGPGRMSVFYVPMMIGNMAAGTVSMKTGFKGANYTTVTACASSTHAIGEAFRKIKDGYLDVCLCGGTESTINEFTLGGFANMKALTKSDNLERASIPFDKERSGFVLGEGCGMLVLEEYEHAKARGAKIYAEIAGYGATCDGYHMTSPAPDGLAAIPVYRGRKCGFRFQLSPLLFLLLLMLLLSMFLPLYITAFQEHSQRYPEKYTAQTLQGYFVYYISSVRATAPWVRGCLESAGKFIFLSCIPIQIRRHFRIPHQKGHRRRCSPP